MSVYMARAAAGDVGAMASLGSSYYYGGTGVRRDYAQALAWYGKAASLGHANSVYWLAHMHEHGEGTPGDLDAALAYYKQAAAQGYSCATETARVEAAIAVRDAELAAARLKQRAAAAAVPALTLEEQNARKEREFALERTRLEQQHHHLEAERARLQHWDTDLKQTHARLEQLDAALRREREAIDAAKREQEARVRATEAAAAAFAQAQRAAAANKQAEFLAARRAAASEDEDSTRGRGAVRAAWTPTQLTLADCPVHLRPIAPGQSVLLDACLHTVCRACAPHMAQPDGTVRCPICQVDSRVDPDHLLQHPFLEATAATELPACVLCQADPAEERLPATDECTTCAPPKLLCPPHTSLHRARQPAHGIVPLASPAGATVAPTRCATHSEPVAAFCTTCCTLVCLACLASTHPAATHAARLLTDLAFVEGVRARLVEGVAVARTVADALIDRAADATAAVSEVDARDAAIASEVDRAINVLVALLEGRRAALHEHCGVQSRTERAALKQTREESEHRWRLLTSAADLAEQLSASATPVMVRLEGAASARLNALIAGLAPEHGMPPPAILRFHINESVGAQLEGLGAVVQDAP